MLGIAGGMRVVVTGARSSPVHDLLFVKRDTVAAFLRRNAITPSSSHEQSFTDALRHDAYEAFVNFCKFGKNANVTSV
jgi:hypothetical protein